MREFCIDDNITPRPYSLCSLTDTTLEPMIRGWMLRVALTSQRRLSYTYSHVNRFFRSISE